MLCCGVCVNPNGAIALLYILLYLCIDNKFQYMSSANHKPAAA
ncbi:hypothetical protein HMPREF9148_01369 [Prevotella sp. F0091]|nr:hypothetical protein HMPREF9148_01369 [Prevotella sp. F0091]